MGLVMLTLHEGNRSFLPPRSAVNPDSDSNSDNLQHALIFSGNLAVRALTSCSPLRLVVGVHWGSYVGVHLPSAIKIGHAVSGTAVDVSVTSP